MQRHQETSSGGVELKVNWLRFVPITFTKHLLLDQADVEIGPFPVLRYRRRWWCGDRSEAKFDYRYYCRPPETAICDPCREVHLSRCPSKRPFALAVVK